jgi:hypothetical protein
MELFDYEKIKTNLFELLVRMVLSAGGDGTAHVISLQYLMLADEFEKYEKAHGNRFIVRTGSNYGIVSFCPEEDFSQEAISFSCDLGVRQIFDMHEIVITLMNIF